MNGLDQRALARKFPGLVHVSVAADGPDDRDDFGPGEYPCCYGSASEGPRGCDCWQAVYDRDQADPVPSPVATRAVCCHDCAYLRGSAEDQAGQRAELLDLACSPVGVFACHQGMRRVVSWRHPDGREIPADPSDYRPLEADGVVYRADGTPAEMCAGWASYRRGMLA